MYSMLSSFQILVVCAAYPWFTAPFLVIFAFFCTLDVVMNRGVVEARKLDNVTKSPVLHHLSSALAGIATIRAYRRQHVFQRKYGFMCS